MPLGTTGILLALITLAIVGIVIISLAYRAKRFKSSKDWQRAERDGGGS